MKSDSDIAAQFKEHYKLSAGLSKQWENTRECQEFYSGDFMSYRDRVETGRKKRKQIVQFNKVKPYVNAVKGFMAQNRRKAKYTARIQDNEQRVQYSEHTNALADYVKENANADQYETQADGDMLIGGYGAIETCMSYGEGYATTDPNGEIVMGRLDPMCIGWNPAAREPNLLDTNFVWYKKEFDLDEAKDLMDADEEDFETEGPAQTKPQYNPGGGPYTAFTEDVNWASRENKTVNVFYYSWYEIEDYWRASNPLFSITDPDTAQFAFAKLQEIAAMTDEDSLFNMNPESKILDCNAEQKTALKEFFEGAIKFDKFKRKKYYSAVLSGDKIFKKVVSESQQGFSVKFKTGDFDEVNKIWTGMVNSMKDPVLYYNKALTELMFTIAAGSKGGVMYERSAVKDIQKFEAEYTKTTSAVMVEDGALSGGRIQPKQQPYQPTGLDALLQIFDSAIPDVNGIDRSFLGSSENKLETAALQRQRIKQVTSVLACYFDSVTLYQRVHARTLLDLLKILVENNPGLMFRVTGVDGDTDLQKADADKLSAEYDVSIQEAPDTATEKRENAELLVGMGRDLLAVQDPSGKAFYAAALQGFPLDSQTKQKLSNILMPEDGAVDPAYVKQLEDMVKQLNSEESKALLESIKTKTHLDKAKVDETMSKVHKNAADTVKSMEEGDKIKVETAMAKMAPPERVSVGV